MTAVVNPMTREDVRMIKSGDIVEWSSSDKAGERIGLVLGPLDGSEHLIIAAAQWGESSANNITIPAEDLTVLSETSQFSLRVWCQDTVSLESEELVVIGHANESSLTRVLRERTKADARWFYDAYHVPRRPQANFDTVGYSGRVFDHREVEFAVDASLDFWLTMGRFSDRLQRNLSEYMGVRRTLLVNSGSAANLLAVSALTSPLLGDRALKPGDEVITTACGFPTTVNPIIQNDCVAVLVDTDPISGNVDVDHLERALSPRSKAVILAHALGNPFNVERVVKFCEENDLWLIEDTCDALGSTYRGKCVGSFGDLSTLSFYPAHHITMGEGGGVNVVSDPKLQRIVESFRDWGRDCWCKSGQDNVCGRRFSYPLGDLPPGYDHKFMYSHIGYNLKPTDWQAAIGCAQFEKIDEFNRLRRRNWGHLRKVFEPYEEFFELPVPESDSDPSWFGFKVLLRPNAPFSRNDLVSYLEVHRIQTRMMFAGNLARQPAYVGRLRADGSSVLRVPDSLDGADRIMNDSFFMGVYPGLTDQHVERVQDVLEAFMCDVLNGGGSSERGASDLRLAARDLSPRRQAFRGTRWGTESS
ncbi:lipopolysaccharide biosynthesis protein RfbH [Streptomyces sp. NPDC058286]|uniref:lipopolysaccharide biosynthesis protein RfbH n=1 Tax=Streptomyces sp. NPDC058286 TaxID=3346422 RepID=UPI0036EEAA20